MTNPTADPGTALSAGNPNQKPILVRIDSTTMGIAGTGQTRPPVFTGELQYSSNILIDSKAKIYLTDTPFHFTVDLTSNVFRPRIASVQKVTIPLCPNINPYNFHVTARVSEGAANDILDFDLSPGIYDPISFSNELAFRLNLALAAAVGPYTGVFTVNFDTVNQTFLVGVTAATMFFIFDQDCTFIVRGRFMHALPGDPLSTAVANYHSLVRGGRSAMLYSRYISIHSQQLTISQYEKSRTSDPFIGNDIIAIVDISGSYTSDDFDVAIPFAICYRQIATSEAPNICVMNSERNLTRYLDFLVKDEYGLALDGAYASVIIQNPLVPDPVRTLTGPSTVGITFWLEIYF